MSIRFRAVVPFLIVLFASITIFGQQFDKAEFHKKHGFEREFESFGRYVGHFIGMSVHDVGANDRPFVAGVVYNVEPFVSDEKSKTHVRLEDTVLVTATGNENLTADVTAEINEIYLLLKQPAIDVRKN